MYFNKYIKIEGTALHFPKFLNKDINFISQLFESSRIIWWVDLRDRYKLINDMFFQWAQLKHILNNSNLFLITMIYQREPNHHVIKGARILSFKEVFNSNLKLQFIVQSHHVQTFIMKNWKSTLDWSKIYLSTHLATTNTNLCSFNIKFLITYSFWIKNCTLLE